MIQLTYKVALVLLATFLFGCAAVQNKPNTDMRFTEPQDIFITLLPQNTGIDDLNVETGVHQAITQKVADQLQEKGYGLFDIKRLMSKQTQTDASLWSTSEIQNYFSKQAKPRMDIVLPVRIYYSLDRARDSLSVGVKSNMLNINSGRSMGVIDIPDRYRKLPANCRGNCLIEHIQIAANKALPDLVTSIDFRLRQLLDGRVWQNQGVVYPDSSDSADRIDGIYIDDQSKPTRPAPQSQEPESDQRIDGILIQ